MYKHHVKKLLDYVIIIFKHVQDLRVKADAAAAMLAHALTPGYFGAKGLGVVMETVDEGRKKRRLLQSAGRIRQSESDRADCREHGLVSSSATNEWNLRLPVQSGIQFVGNQEGKSLLGMLIKIIEKIKMILPPPSPCSVIFLAYFLT